MRLRVTVIGGGVVGSAIAAKLAERSVDVTLLEAGRLAGGTSGASFAWVNSNGKMPVEYHALNTSGMEAHRRFAEEAQNPIWFHPGGSIYWSDTEAELELLSQNVARLKSLNYPVTWLDRSQTIDLEPSLALSPLPSEGIAYFPSEVWVDPHVLTAALVTKARADGAKVLTNTPVTSLTLKNNRISEVVCSDEIFETDLVINCAGPEAGIVAQMAGVTLPLRNEPGVTLVTEALPINLQRIVRNSHFSVRPDGGGRLLVGSHKADTEITGSYAVMPGTVKMLLGEIRTLFPDSPEAQSESIRVGTRPVPVDGLPILGFDDIVTNFYQAVQHSGITLCLELARIISNHILDEEPLPAGELYRVGAPGRHGSSSFRAE